MDFIYEKIWKDESGFWRCLQKDGTVERLTESWLNIYITQLKDATVQACAAMRDLKKT